MENFAQSWQNSFELGWAYTIAQFSTVLPRLIGAFLVFVIGLVIVRFLRRVVVRTLLAFRLSKMVETTPLELFLKNAEFGQKFEEIVGGLVYWLGFFIVLQTSVSMLGLTPLAQFLDKIFSYLPHVFTGFVIFLFGVLVAGVVESVIKGTLRTFDARSARLFAKIASYVVVTITTLAAVAELGIARDFILIVFIGATAACSLGLGLAFGLGGQDTIRRMMADWYDRKHDDAK
jgi:hypothetical protein